MKPEYSSPTGERYMSRETSSIETVTLPRKPGDWEADVNIWMKVDCNMETTESEGSKILRVRPLSEMMNFSIWKNATKYESLDLEESEWKSFSFTHANHLSDLESATLSLYHDVNYWERNILPDLSGDWKTLEYALPSASPGGYWNKVGMPRKIKYILFKFSGKAGILTGSFEIKEAHLVRAPPKT